MLTGGTRLFNTGTRLTRPRIALASCADLCIRPQARSSPLYTSQTGYGEFYARFYSTIEDMSGGKGARNNEEKKEKKKKKKSGQEQAVWSFGNVDAKEDVGKGATTDGKEGVELGAEDGVKKDVRKRGMKKVMGEVKQDVGLDERDWGAWPSMSMSNEQGSHPKVSHKLPATILLKQDPMPEDVAEPVSAELKQKQKKDTTNWLVPNSHAVHQPTRDVVEDSVIEMTSNLLISDNKHKDLLRRVRYRLDSKKPNNTAAKQALEESDFDLLSATLDRSKQRTAADADSQEPLVPSDKVEPPTKEERELGSGLGEVDVPPTKDERTSAALPSEISTPTKPKPKRGKDSPPIYTSNDSFQMNQSILALFDRGSNDIVPKICYNLLISTAAPDLFTYNVLLRRFTLLRRTDLAQIVIHALLKAGFHPDDYTFSAMLSLFTASGNAAGFIEVVNIMGPAKDEMRNMVIATSLINGFAKFRKLPEMAAYMAGMKSRTLRPGKEILTAQLKLCAEHRDWVRGLPPLKRLMKLPSEEMDDRAWYWAWRFVKKCRQAEAQKSLMKLAEERNVDKDWLLMPPQKTKGLKLRATNKNPLPEHIEYHNNNRTRERKDYGALLDHLKTLQTGLRHESRSQKSGPRPHRRIVKTEFLDGEESLANDPRNSVDTFLSRAPIHTSNSVYHMRFDSLKNEMPIATSLNAIEGVNGSRPPPVRRTLVADKEGPELVECPEAQVYRQMLTVKPKLHQYPVRRVVLVSTYNPRRYEGSSVEISKKPAEKDLVHKAEDESCNINDTR